MYTKVIPFLMVGMVSASAPLFAGFPNQGSCQSELLISEEETRSYVVSSFPYVHLKMDGKQVVGIRAYAKSLVQEVNDPKGTAKVINVLMGAYPEVRRLVLLDGGREFFLSKAYFQSLLQEIRKYKGRIKEVVFLRPLDLVTLQEVAESVSPGVEHFLAVVRKDALKDKPRFGRELERLLKVPHRENFILDVVD